MESKQSPSDKKLPHYIHILEGSVTAAYDDFEDSGADEYINEEGPESESDDGMAVEEEEEESKPTKQTKTKKHGRNDIAAIRNTATATGTQDPRLYPLRLFAKFSKWRRFCLDRFSQICLD